MFPSQVFAGCTPPALAITCTTASWRARTAWRSWRSGTAAEGVLPRSEAGCATRDTGRAAFQDSEGTVDEKIPYALDDLRAPSIAGCIAYAGRGFSKGVLHMLEAPRRMRRIACLSPVRPKRHSIHGNWIICFQPTFAGGMCCWA